MDEQLTFPFDKKVFATQFLSGLDIKCNLSKALGKAYCPKCVIRQVGTCSCRFCMICPKCGGHMEEIT
jgi:hypothetical protein